jgi:hypothetical protein
MSGDITPSVVPKEYNLCNLWLEFGSAPKFL